MLPNRDAQMSSVITYQFAYVPGTISLCTAHDSDVYAGGTLGPVSHGLHSGTCDVCADHDERVRAARAAADRLTTTTTTDLRSGPWARQARGGR